MPRSVVVTGATGFIGRHLTAALVGHGVAVRAVLRPDSASTPPAGATVVRAPLDAAALRSACAGADAVIHLAGVVQTGRPAAYGRINVEGTRAVAIAARDAGARMIHVSSLAAAGPAPAGAPHREPDVPRPVTPYGRSKLTSEQIVRDTAGLRWTILRPGAVYGPGDRAVLPIFRLVARGILPIVGDPATAYTFVHVDDLVRALWTAIDLTADGEVLFVGHPQPVTATELIDGIEAAVGRRARRVPVPRPVIAVGAAIGDLFGLITGTAVALNGSRYAEIYSPGFVCCVERLKERLGVEAAVGLRGGLVATADWYRRAGWLRSAPIRNSGPEQNI